MFSGCKCGPGFASPTEATKGPRENLLYVTCVQPNGVQDQKPDYLAVVDVDPVSSNYGKVIGRCFAKTFGDEFHHTGWNSCSSCHGDARYVRDKLILPCLSSNRIYVIDTSVPNDPRVEKVVDNLSEFGVCAPHTSHCLQSGEIMVSCMGDAEGGALGSFLLLDGKTFNIKGTWGERTSEFGYDFWYQPRHDVLVSTEWGAPCAWRGGFNPQDVADGKYGSALNFWSWKDRKFLKRLDLGQDGLLPLEVRFLHDPEREDGFVGCALSSSVFHISKGKAGDWIANKVIQVEPKNVTNWLLPTMPGVITDIIVSMDDKFFYFSNWVQGDVRQYDIRDPSSPKLVGQLFLGGSLCRDGPVQVVDEPFDSRPERAVVRGSSLRGGPQMLQLSLDGKRLYVTNSLYSGWDKQFYPDLIKNGAQMVLIDVDTEVGGLQVNADFLVDFGAEPNGPVLAHEMRYPGGDCTSDIFV